MSMVRVAVVGTGAWWGRQHAVAFSTRSDARLCAVVGRTPERTEQRAAEFGVPGYVDVEQMLEEEAPDLVSVCLPNEAHFEPTTAGHPRRLPPAGREAARLRPRRGRSAPGRGRRAAAVLRHQLQPPLRKAGAAGARGDARGATSGALTFATWRFGGEAGTSAHPHANLIETQCHGLDMLEHLCGPISSVMAQMTDVTGRGYSTMSVALQFDNGAVGSLLGSYDSSYSYPDTHRLELNGLDGRVVVEDTVRRYTFTPSGSETSSVWQAGYFNDRDRHFHATFDRYLDAMMPGLRRRAAATGACRGRPARAAAVSLASSSPSRPAPGSAPSDSPGCQAPHRLDGVGLGGGLVVAVADDPGEPQRQAAGVARRALEAVEGDLDDLLGADRDDVRRAVGLGPVASSVNRSVCQASISSVMPLNVLPSMTKPVSAESSRAPRWMLDSQPLRRPRAPLDGEHDQVEGVHRLDLDPRRSRAGRRRRARRGS